jgi:hypothetical protein
VKPDLQLLFEARVALEDPIVVGDTPSGMRRVVQISGGTFEGPEMRGTVEAGGADWQYQRADGVMVLDARYLLRTHDGVLIAVRNVGLRHGPEEVMRRLAAGEAVDPASYYFRAAPSFSAPSGKYAALNRALYLCTGERHARAVRLWVYRVL